MKTKVILTTVIGIIFLNVSLKAQIKINNNGNVGVKGEPSSSNCEFKIYGSAEIKKLRIGKTSTPLTDCNFKVHGTTEMTDLRLGTTKRPLASLAVGPGPYLPYAAPWSIWAYGRIAATVFTTVSDKRLKKDIQTISNPMADLMKVSGKSYYFVKEKEEKLQSKPKSLKSANDTISKNNNGEYGFTEGRKFGLLAQDIKEIYPELVHYNQAEDIYSIDYIGFIPIIIEALKDQQAEIIELKNKSKKKAKLKNAGAANSEIITNATLSPARPNPFNTETSIEYYLPANVSKATLYIYDLQGKQIKSINIVQREYGSETIYASELTPGMYKYALIADGSIVGTETMILTQ